MGKSIIYSVSIDDGLFKFQQIWLNCLNFEAQDPIFSFKLVLFDLVAISFFFKFFGFFIKGHFYFVDLSFISLTFFFHPQNKLLVFILQWVYLNLLFIQ